MFAKGADDQSLDFCGGHPIDHSGLVRLPLNEYRRDVIAIAHAILDGMRRRHAVAARVKDAADQQGLRFLSSLAVIVPLLVKFSLNRLEQRAIEDGWLL